MTQVGWYSPLTDTLGPLHAWAGDALPRALTAGVLLLVGWLLARLLRVWVARGVARLGGLIGVRPRADATRPAGVDPGTKLQKAESAGVPVLDEAAFLAILDGAAEVPSRGGDSGV